MEKDSLLEELAEAIAQGPIIFTPDDYWEEKLEEKKNET